MAVNFLFGISEAGAFPVATDPSYELWFPPRERGLAQSVSHSANRLVAAVSPPIVVAIVATLGWQWVFDISVAIGSSELCCGSVTYGNMSD